MKYILELDDSSCTHECGMDFYQCKQIPWWNVSDRIISKLLPYTEPDRKPIEDEVWELADYMCKMSTTERTLCFAFEYPSEVTTNFTFQEAKALFEKWMKSENEIHVGDEVTDVDGVKCIITYVHNGLCDVLCL